MESIKKYIITKIHAFIGSTCDNIYYSKSLDCYYTFGRIRKFEYNGKDIADIDLKSLSLVDLYLLLNEYKIFLLQDLDHSRNPDKIGYHYASDYYYIIDLLNKEIIVDDKKRIKCIVNKNDIIYDVDTKKYEEYGTRMTLNRHLEIIDNLMQLATKFNVDEAIAQENTTLQARIKELEAELTKKSDIIKKLTN